MLDMRLRQYFVDSCCTVLAGRPEILATIAQSWQDKTGLVRPGQVFWLDPAELLAGSPPIIDTD
jgi:hypothetical protein